MSIYRDIYNFLLIILSLNKVWFKIEYLYNHKLFMVILKINKEGFRSFFFSYVIYVCL